MGDPDGRPGRLTIVTHRKPHLDEVVASWLLRTFDPAFQDCQFQFIANSPTGGQIPPGDHIVPLGIGRGKYDEHGLKAGQSATKLVYEDLLKRGLIPNDRYEDKALAWLVEYTHKEDTAQWQIHELENRSFSLPAILRGIWVNHKGGDPDQDEMRLGLEMIDGLVTQLNERAKFLSDWDQRIEFVSPWGKAVGLRSTYRGSDAFAYQHGFILRVQTDPSKPYGDFRGEASSTVDLTSIYDQLQKLEPNAWFLHQTKKILVSNSDSSAGNKRPATTFSLQQLIDFVKQ